MEKLNNKSQEKQIRQIDRNKAISGPLSLNKESDPNREMSMRAEAEPAFQKLDEMEEQGNPEANMLNEEHNRLISRVSEDVGHKPFYKNAVEDLRKFRKEKLGIDEPSE